MTSKKLKESMKDVRAPYPGTIVPPPTISPNEHFKNGSEEITNGKNASIPHTKTTGFKGER